MKKTSLTALILTLCCVLSFGQSIEVQHVNPTNWFVGMKNPRLQILLHGKDISGVNVKLNYPGVTLEKVNKVENPNYLFLDLVFDISVKAGTMNFELTKVFPVTKKRRGEEIIVGGREVTQSLPYQLLPRTAKPQTVDSRDFIYLLLPDRFANGDTSNDRFPQMADPNADRKNPFYRHGGDLLGIEKNLDYIKELGATAIWLNPVIENNQPLTDEGGTMRSAYHGYGFTDHYNIDRRLGGNAAYKKLIDAAHDKGLKIMYDAVYNHVGINHWFIKDLPEKEWLNNWPKYTNTSYHEQPVADLYAAAIDRKVTHDGWFVPFLPDLNQKNPRVVNFLIQHSLWLIEYFNIDSYRVDTYFYNDLEVMNSLNKAILDEHPNFYITGENSVKTILAQAYLAQNNLNVPFKSNLPSANDFMLYNAFNASLNENFGFNEGLNRMYETLTQDYVYQDATKCLTFLDNHDQDRFFSVIGEDFDKFKMGTIMLLTTRGVPSWYYGTEILMKNFKNPSDAEVRRDFPGGFPGDSLNKFLASNRTPRENEAFDFVKTLANYRKNSAALQTGKLTHYLPEKGTYVYFRYDANKTVMVAINTNKTESKLETARFSEHLNGFSGGTDILKGSKISFESGSLGIPAKTALVVELTR